MIRGIQQVNVEFWYLSCRTVTDGNTIPEMPGTPIALYVVIGILLTSISLLALAVTVRCTGVDHLFFSRTAASTSDKAGSSSVGRSSSRQQRRTCRRSAAAASTAKRLSKSASGNKGRLRIADVGRTVTALGSDVAISGGGPRGGSSVGNGTKSNRLMLPAASDSSPGTERTISEFAGQVTVLTASSGADVNRLRSPLLVAELGDEPAYVGDNEE